jgi:hypothetical protein
VVKEPAPPEPCVVPPLPTAYAKPTVKPCDGWVCVSPADFATISEAIRAGAEWRDAALGCPSIEVADVP